MYEMEGIKFVEGKKPKLRTRCYRRNLDLGKNDHKILMLEMLCGMGEKTSN